MNIGIFELNLFRFQISNHQDVVLKWNFECINIYFSEIFLCIGSSNYANSVNEYEILVVISCSEFFLKFIYFTWRQRPILIKQKEKKYIPNKNLHTHVDHATLFPLLTVIHLVQNFGRWGRWLHCTKYVLIFSILSSSLQFYTYFFLPFRVVTLPLGGTPLVTQWCSFCLSSATGFTFACNSEFLGSFCRRIRL